MLIVCPTCATSYDIDAASLRPNGRQVRCVRCRAIWRAELSQADKLIAAAEALAPVRRAVEAMAEAAGEETASSSPEDHPAEMADSAADDAAGALSSRASAESPRAVAESPDSDAPPNDAVEVESPPIAPVDLDAGPPPIQAAMAETVQPAEPHEDIETIAARRYRPGAKRKKWAWPLSRLQSAIMALVIVDAIVIGWRADFVRILPQTAAFYASIGLPVNLRGVNFDSLATATEQHENVPILVVEGNIVNDVGKMTDVPRLRFAVRNAAREEIYAWTAVPPRAVLSPGETVSFRTRLASPPPDAHDVLVRFVNRFDMLSGTR
jgi:predicted Zn finger-like uncharacterized protein